MPKNKPAFWADFSKKTATWGSVAVLAVSAGEMLEQVIEGAEAKLGGWHLALAVVAAAVVRAIVGLIQGNTGDGQKASFTKPPTPQPTTTDTTPTD